jgi:hypothetical protein
VFEKPPTLHNKIQFFPILADTLGYLSDDPPLTGTHTILATENLTIENVSHLIKPNTFSLWKANCMMSKDTSDDLEHVKYAIVHRYSTVTERDSESDTYSTELGNLAIACLSLVRPTRRSRAMHVMGIIRDDGSFDPQSFNTIHEPAVWRQAFFPMNDNQISPLVFVVSRRFCRQARSEALCCP